MLVAVLFEILVVTGFLIGAAVGFFFAAPVLAGLVFAGISLFVTSGRDAVRAAPRRLVHPRHRRRREGGHVGPRSPAAQRRRRDGDGREPAGARGVRHRAGARRTRSPSGATRPTPRSRSRAGCSSSSTARSSRASSPTRWPTWRTSTRATACWSRCMVGAVVILTDVFFEAVLEMVQHPSFDADDLERAAGRRSRCGSRSRSSRSRSRGRSSCSRRSPRGPSRRPCRRDREYLADATSVALTRNPAGLVVGAREARARRARAAATRTAGTQHLWIVNPVARPERRRPRLVRHPPGDRGPDRPPARARRRGARSARIRRRRRWRDRPPEATGAATSASAATGGRGSEAVIPRTAGLSRYVTQVRGERPVVPGRPPRGCRDDAVPVPGPVDLARDPHPVRGLLRDAARRHVHDEDVHEPGARAALEDPEQVLEVAGDGEALVEAADDVELGAVGEAARGGGTSRRAGTACGARGSSDARGRGRSALPGGAGPCARSRRRARRRPR